MGCEGAVTSTCGYGAKVLMEKGDIAILIALASAGFSAWQAYSGHVSTQIAINSSKRKHPAFEIVGHQFIDFDGWTTIEITARNFEPVSVNIVGISYRKSGTLLLPDEARWSRSGPAYAPDQVKELPRSDALQKIVINRTIGPSGEQASSNPKATIFLRAFACGAFDPKHLIVDWRWADGSEK